MSEINEAISAESFNFADLFSIMGDPVFIFKEKEKNGVLDKLEDVEKKLLGIYEEEQTQTSDIKEEKSAETIGYKIDWSEILHNRWQDTPSDRIAIENALKILDENEKED